MSAAVVFVNYHSEALIEPRARALSDAGFVVVVADNSGTFPALQTSDLRVPVVVVDCGGNVGFGAACNRAVSALPDDVDAICLHNPDVDASPVSIRALIARLSATTAALAPTVVTGSRARTRGYHYPSPARERYLAWRFVRGREREPGRTEPPGPARRHRGWGRRFGTAALLAVGRDAFESIDGFDERFFLYGEDLDLWHRLTVAGFEPTFASDVVVTHAGRGGSPLAAGSRELLRQLGVQYFAERHDARSWRRSRDSHERFVERLGAPSNLVDAVQRAWAAGQKPSEVLDQIRPLVDGQVMSSIR